MYLYNNWATVLGILDIKEAWDVIGSDSFTYAAGSATPGHVSIRPLLYE